MLRQKLHIVWFKRDLRVQDHAALTLAAERASEDGGGVLPLYVMEPELWAEPDYSGRHYVFLRECLNDLRDRLARLGQPLVIRTGPVMDILASLNNRHGIAALYSHEETGNGWTFRRDRAVATWCRAHGLPWHETRSETELKSGSAPTRERPGPGNWRLSSTGHRSLRHRAQTRPERSIPEICALIGEAGSRR